MGSGAEILDQFIRGARPPAAKLHVRSAINPLLWLAAFVGVPSLGLTYLTREELGPFILFGTVGAVTVLAPVLAYFYFAVFAPHRLQSEDYQIRHEALELIRTKGSPIAISPSSLEAIANPALAALPSPEAE